MNKASMRLSHPACLLVLLLTLVGTVEAQWKWKDSSGNVQYSDRPPPAGTPEKDILQKPPQRAQPVVVRPFGVAASAAEARPAASAASSAAEAQQQARRRQQEQEQAAKQKEEERKQAAVRAENCKNARSQLALLESGARVSRSNEQGEQVVMNEQQRGEDMQRARAIIGSECR